VMRKRILAFPKTYLLLFIIIILIRVLNVQCLKSKITPIT
jgi:hypothetical protein